MASGSSKFTSTDLQNPLFVHPSDGPLSVVVTKLEGSHDYRTWKRSIEIQLSAKRKLGFVDGTLSRSTTDAAEASQWDTCNNLIHGEDEWSFGYCEQGSGVFRCPSGKNPMYTYRECIVLGKTNFSISKVNQILREISREWPGQSYDLLSKNCNHFCDEFCERLGAPKLPGWVNRFANAGDTAVEIAANTAFRLRQAKTEIVTASKVAYRFLLGVNSNSAASSESAGNADKGTTKFQTAWFKNLVSAGPKVSGNSEIRVGNKESFLQQRRL